VVIDTTTDAVLGSQHGLLDELDLEAIDSWFDGLVAPQERRGARGGCPLGSLVGQLAERDEETRAALVSGFGRWEEPRIAGLKRMQEHGDMGGDVSVKSLADVTLAAIQGGLLLTQVRRDSQQLRRALDGARVVLAEAVA
jgi:TetR/AcrR family transcriptional regulator, transcriptional repressor for nem operon